MNMDCVFLGFCIPEQYEPEELDAYFAMHFQDVLQYHVWMTATIVVSENKTDRTEWIPNCKADLPVYTNVKKICSIPQH